MTTPTETAPSRSYKLKRGEALGDGLRRIARGRADHALEMLEDGDDRAAAVHETRKDMKKLAASEPLRRRLSRNALDEVRSRTPERALAELAHGYDRALGATASEVEDVELARAA